ncbi:MAG TPA: hypothetical protein VFF43_20120 [Caldimonas sp.]|nr:hypothetical protein [Caldimonas sp.]
MKMAAFFVGLLIAAVGVTGLIAPAALYTIASWFTSPDPWYLLAVVRIAVGVLLLIEAKVSRAPRAVRVVAFIPILAGIAIPFIGVERAGAMVQSWLSVRPAVARLSVLPVLALGSFIAWAFAPAGRATKPT